MSPAGVSRQQLLDLYEVRFEVADAAKRRTLALGLNDCLAGSDRVLRDEVAFAALQSWIWNGQLARETLDQIRVAQLAAIRQPDQSGIAQPNAAQMLGELVHADRDQRFLTGPQRAEILQAGTAYLSNLRDYRALDEKEGWRHGVAKAAYLMHELAQHPALGRGDQLTILAAVQSQLAAAGTQKPPAFFYFMEGSRLAEAVAAIAARKDIETAEWEQWFTALVKPDPHATEVTVPLMARVHNLQSFLMPLHIALTQNQDCAPCRRVLPLVAKALKRTS